MYPSSCRIRATSAFSFEAGISTRAWRAVTAFRIRVSMSAIGSVISISLYGLRSESDGFSRRCPAMAQAIALRESLPATLRYTRDVAGQGQLAETQTAQRKLAHIRA